MEHFPPPWLYNKALWSLQVTFKKYCILQRWCLFALEVRRCACAPTNPAPVPTNSIPAYGRWLPVAPAPSVFGSGTVFRVPLSCQPTARLWTNHARNSIKLMQLLFWLFRFEALLESTYSTRKPILHHEYLFQLLGIAPVTVHNQENKSIKKDFKKNFYRKEMHHSKLLIRQPDQYGMLERYCTVHWCTVFNWSNLTIVCPTKKHILYRLILPKVYIVYLQCIRLFSRILY
jgi:hypothetical protein